jgi:hypothetical protein
LLNSLASRRSIDRIPEQILNRDGLVTSVEFRLAGFARVMRIWAHRAFIRC